VLESARSIAMTSSKPDVTPDELSAARSRAKHLLELLDSRLSMFLLATDPDASATEIGDDIVESVAWDSVESEALEKCCISRRSFFSVLRRIPWLPVHVTPSLAMSPMVPWPDLCAPFMAPAAVRPIDDVWFCSATRGILDSPLALCVPLRRWLGFHLPLPSVDVARQLLACANMHAHGGENEVLATVAQKLSSELPAVMTALLKGLYVPESGALCPRRFVVEDEREMFL
jgi:hypothetical protein